MASENNTNKDSNEPSKKNEFYVPPPRKTVPDEKGEFWGHDLYPQRRGEKPKSLTKTIFLSEGKENLEKFYCEKRLYKCALNHPLVKLMMNALRSSGCPIDLRRHLSCEVCDPAVTGGYDPELNQIVVCQNNVKKDALVASTLTHEMIHMFDYCRNNLDFKNLDHLACTEIRAANLTYCSFLSAMMDGDAALWDVKKRHQDCVKRRALMSVLAARGVSKEVATAAVERVFDKCYNDMEPIGRRIRRGSQDMDKALFEASYYGYDPQ